MPIVTIVRTFTTATPGTALAAAASDSVIAVSGYEIAGATGGLIAGILGLIGTYIALRSNAAAARRQYQAELQAQYDRGVSAAEARARVQLEAANTRLTDIREAASERIRSLEADVKYWREQGGKR